jgi:hypothetical protein
MLRIKKIIIGLGVVFCSLVVSEKASAAFIYFEPASVTKAVGESFTMNIRLNTEGENVNAVDVTLTYPPLLVATGISKSGSAVQLWVQDPSYTNSTLSLTGGVPGGLNSSSALLARVTFQARAVGDGGLSLGGGSSVLLNDGQGTRASLRLVGNVVHVTAKSGGKTPIPSITPKTSGNESASPTPWEVPSDGEDTDKPKKFIVSVEKDARVFGGKHFVSFFTTDETSGVDHYEIKEGSAPYKIARTPYLLTDQKLRSVVRVRAYDSAGNYRESVYPGILKRMVLWIINLF